ncbi:MAG: glycosyltransferase [Acidimicrobiales bacterium]|nr:glycosyltransferase [Acidimicrobiales bacterium]
MHPTIDYWGHGYASGYGVAAQRLVLALLGHGLAVRWTPIEFAGTDPRFQPSRRGSVPDLEHHRRGQRRFDALVLHATPEIIPAAQQFRGDAALICHTVWESEHIQSHWPELLNRCDGVIVPTEWNAETFRRGGVTAPIEVVPHVARPDTIDEVAWLDDLAGRFVVYTVAAWSPRKAPWLAMEAFARAFDPDDDTVAFVLKTGPEVFPGQVDVDAPSAVGDRTWFAMAKVMGRLGPTPEIRIIDRFLTESELGGLHQRGDCFLGLSHGEGWDLGAFDAAMSGTPVVVTDWGAPPLYLDRASSWLVPARSVPTGLRDWGESGSGWAQPDLDRAVAMLREIRADPAAATQRAMRQVEPLRTEYAPEPVARRFLGALDRLLGR